MTNTRTFIVTISTDNNDTSADFMAGQIRVALSNIGIADWNIGIADCLEQQNSEPTPTEPPTVGGSMLDDLRKAFFY